MIVEMNIDPFEPSLTLNFNPLIRTDIYNCRHAESQLFYCPIKHFINKPRLFWPMWNLFRSCMGKTPCWRLGMLFSVYSLWTQNILSLKNLRAAICFFPQSFQDQIKTGFLGLFLLCGEIFKASKHFGYLTLDSNFVYIFLIVQWPKKQRSNWNLTSAK